MAVKLIKGLAGAYRLGYASGETCEFSKEFEQELIDKKFAVAIPKETDKNEPGRLHADVANTNEGEVVSKGNKQRSGRRNKRSDK